MVEKNGWNGNLKQRSCKEKKGGVKAKVIAAAKSTLDQDMTGDHVFTIRTSSFLRQFKFGSTWLLKCWAPLSSGKQKESHHAGVSLIRHAQMGAGKYFSLWFHLPRCHFGSHFLSQSQMRVGSPFFTEAQVPPALAPGSLLLNPQR